MRIDGEDISSPTAFQEGNFMSKNWLSRVFVLIAGVAMNFVLAWMLFTGLFLMGAKPLSAIPFDIGKTHSFFLPSIEESLDSGYLAHSGVLMSPLSGSIAEAAGIRDRDIVIAMNGNAITSVAAVIETIQSQASVELTLLRDGGTELVNIEPQDGKIGVSISELFAKNPEYEKRLGVMDAAVMGAHETYATSYLTFTLVKKTL